MNLSSGFPKKADGREVEARKDFQSVLNHTSDEA
jgi:hypothetical protein